MGLVLGEPRFACDRIESLEPGGGPARFRDRNGAIQRHDG
jgi:hypothetical protein